MSQADFNHYDPMDAYDDEEISIPYCGICDTQLVPKTDSRYNDKIWFTCPECKKAIEHNSDLESLNTELTDRWLLAERRYMDLQDSFKAKHL